jgi:hypothetical protein
MAAPAGKHLSDSHRAKIAASMRGRRRLAYVRDPAGSWSASPLAQVLLEALDRAYRLTHPSTEA